MVIFFDKDIKKVYKTTRRQDNKFFKKQRNSESQNLRNSGKFKVQWLRVLSSMVQSSKFNGSLILIDINTFFMFSLTLS